MDGLAGDRGIKSKRWSDSKNYLSDNMCPFAKYLKTPIFTSLDGTIWFFPIENISDKKAYAELALSQKSGFCQK